MFKKLLIAFIVLNAITITALAVVFPNKNEHIFRFSKSETEMRIENYHERHWKLLPPKDWGMDLLTFSMCWGCGPLGSRGEGVRRFGFIGIVEKKGWRTTEEEWLRVHKMKKKN